jgi:hypothetical protein
VSELGAKGFGLEPAAIPTFSECVVGYRAWRVGSGGLLWPLSDARRAWQPGVNTARCNCETGLSLSFEWTLVDGHRVLERAPAHDAPADECACGLYSWRRPKRMWGSDDRYVRGDLVAGAVASWGRVQVHETGLRAEHACIVTLSFPATISEAARARLSGVAERYHVELVPLNELEVAASIHGSPLPDTLMPPRDDADDLPDDAPQAARTPAQRRAAPDSTIGEVDRQIDLARQRHTPKRKHVVAFLIVVVALIVAVILLAHRSTPCKLQITNVGGGAQIEQCANTSGHAP